MVQLVAFDLDGTLVRTIDDIAGALNFALAENGFPTLSVPAVEAIVGYSTGYMFQHAVPADHADDWKKVGAIYDVYYPKHCCDNSFPYEGIQKTLRTLKNAGIKLAVVSNKPHRDSLTVVETLFPRDTFNMVLGRMPRFPTKPAPDGLQFVLEYLGVAPENAVYVGDSEVDIRFAENAGIRCVSVSWGYRDRSMLLASRATEILDDPGELAETLLSK